MQKFTTVRDATLADRVMDAALTVTRLVRREVRRSAAGLTSSQLRALSFVQWNEGASLAEVAEYVGLGAPAASRMIEELVRRGLVSRVASESDRRRISVRLLPSGAAALESALATARAPLADRLARLSEAEREDLARALASLTAAMNVDVAGMAGGADE